MTTIRFPKATVKSHAAWRTDFILTGAYKRMYIEIKKLGF